MATTILFCNIASMILGALAAMAQNDWIHFMWLTM